VTVQREAGWTVVVPDTLLSGASGWPRRWGLTRIVSRGVRRTLGIHGSYDVIGWSITGHAAPTSAWAPAPVSWIADFGGEAPLGVLRIDPVCLTPGPRGLSMMSSGSIDVGIAEAARLGDALSAEFRSRGIGVRIAAADRWYMTLPHLPDIPWWAPEAVAGDSVFPFLPAGEAGAELRRIVNEIQVVLHDHPDNAGRRDRLAPEVNSVWAWGWARRPLPRVGAVVARVHADHPYARGLAMLAGTRVSGPERGEEPADSGAVVAPGDREDDPEWLETVWGRCLRRAADRKRTTMVRLVTPGGQVVEYAPGLPGRSRRLWARSK